MTKNRKLYKGFSTSCVQDHMDFSAISPHILPIFGTSSFKFESLEDSISVFKNLQHGYVYSRYANPTVDYVAQKIASLEIPYSDKNPWGVMTSSGMSAIYSLITSILRPGDCLICSTHLYGGTSEMFLKVLNEMNIKIVPTQFSDEKNIIKAIEANPTAKLLFMETPSNPTLECYDLSKVAEIAKTYHLMSIVDNTLCTPYLQQPLAHGIDFVIHSTTKYLNGHGNGIGGIILSYDREELRRKIAQQVKLIGSQISPFEAWLVYNGLKTLELRMERHCSNALKLAEFLSNHPYIEEVNYPGLAHHPGHHIAQKQMFRGFGGMLSFRIKNGSFDRIKNFMDNLKIATQAPTLGDVDTLVLHPYTSSHLNLTEEQKKMEGVTIDLVRMSVGIENIEDLLEDLENALQMASHS